jgi:hypothetical protein
MLPTYISRVTTAMLLAAVALPALAADIDIKGVRLGMTQDELVALGATTNAQQKLVLPDFTVGGVKAFMGDADLGLKEGRLDTFTFFFAPSDFDEVLAAVKAKYPKTKCTDSQLQNGFGAKFTQTYCTLSDAKTTLQVRRMVSKEFGLLSLVPTSTLQKQDAQAQKAKGDI